MTKKVNTLTICYLFFLILLFLSGGITGILSEVVYFLAFILPLCLALYLTRKEERADKNSLVLNRENIKITLPIIAPTVSAVMLISFVTSVIIFSLTGKTNSVSVGDSLILALISHALLPALLEEMLFRYLPMRLLASHSKRCAVFVSAFFFALVHHDLFSIPYAFLAGVIFMTVDLATDSVIPSVIIHFINNAISVGLLVYTDNPAFAPTVYVILGVATLISLIVVFKDKRSYFEKLSSAFARGEGVKFTLEMLLFAALTLTVAIVGLF
ncbi:MAG: CPBP family intramembrane metalloprotease [Clostridia bacterium]|nr:CPBP family intramembrane metalloprotease [Clostridia bacterium]